MSKIQQEKQLSYDQLKNEMMHFKQRYEMFRDQLQKEYISKVKILAQHLYLT